MNDLEFSDHLILHLISTYISGKNNTEKNTSTKIRKEINQNIK